MISKIPCYYNYKKNNQSSIHLYRLSDTSLFPLGYIPIFSRIHLSYYVMYHLLCISPPRNVSERNEKSKKIIIGKTFKIGCKCMRYL